ncbi:hypothetical protein [Clostridium sp. LP20]|uniref:hypothetical protein n=1 Tax=Clostridium sp. LP20 TaxID=3418665 RepID=UPI003EE5063F
MKAYRIFLSPLDNKIRHKSQFRIDLFGDMKINEVKELEGFTLLYSSKGHSELINIKGEMVTRTTRYVQAFKKDIERK